MKKQIIAFFLLFVLLVPFIFTVSAAEPRLNNTFSTSTSFVISNTGKATIAAAYDGYRGVTTDVTVTSYIEKRTLGIFWTKVDINQPNNEWIDTASYYVGAFSHEFQLEDTGTYRATVVYEISGTGGATDVIEYEQERTYS